MSATFHFRKSWGAEPAEGGARFRIWAASQPEMALRVAASGADLPMREAGDGWFELETDAVRIGEGYSFVLPDGTAVNDSAARAQMDGVTGPSRLVDPTAYEWRSSEWRGRPWEESVFYELHTGTFSPEGSFDGIRRRLDHLVETGITAVELLPVAQFGGNRGWGYDGVLLYAPHPAYGGPEGLKRLIDAAHERGLMMFLDVVYNHFGPDGNYLGLYAPDFFHPENHTPWGAAIAYEKRPVRDFFIENALYWLEEYRFDGLRLDAVDQIARQTQEPVLEEIAHAVRTRIPDRHVHLTTEDDRNVAHLHERDSEGRPKLYSGEWNDDFHHAAHVLATGETDGYYCDFSGDPVGQLARALASGFVYQGQPSPFRDGETRGVPSANLPPSAFVNFLQNHDQIGNRAFNERLTTLADFKMVKALTTILLLSPQIPLLFMGEEFGETRPFGFFTDFHGALGDAVREGRRREFAKWTYFAHEEHRERIADPNAESTFEGAKLDWGKIADYITPRDYFPIGDGRPPHHTHWEHVRWLLHARQREVVPLIGRIGGNAGAWERLGETAFTVTWRVDDSRALRLYANLGDKPFELSEPPRLRSRKEMRPEQPSDGYVFYTYPYGGVRWLDSKRAGLSPFSAVFAKEGGAAALPPQ